LIIERSRLYYYETTKKATKVVENQALDLRLSVRPLSPTNKYMKLINSKDLDEIRAREVAISSISIENRRNKQEEALNLEETKALIQASYDNCPWCLANEELAVGGHTLLGCSKAESRSLKTKVYEFRQYLRSYTAIAPYSACFDCYLPQELCRKWSSRGGRGFIRNKAEESYSYPDFVIPIFVVGLSIEGFSSGYLDRLRNDGITRGTREEYLYLGRKMDWGEIETNRLFVEFSLALKVVLEVYQDFIIRNR